MEPDPLEAQSRPIAPTFFPVCPPAPLLSLPAASLRPPRPLPGPGRPSPPRQGRGSPARGAAEQAPVFLPREVDEEEAGTQMSQSFTSVLSGHPKDSRFHFPPWLGSPPVCVEEVEFDMNGSQGRGNAAPQS